MHRERAGDRELAEQNGCFAVTLICMIKGRLIATLSCGVLIIRYRIIKGHATAFSFDLTDRLFGEALALAWRSCLLPTHAVRNLIVAVESALAFPLKHPHVFLFLSYFSPQGLVCTAD